MQAVSGKISISKFNISRSALLRDYAYDKNDSARK